uniref:Uncharacterized protein n=1 Tax=Eptatretus burgeri TaxID=7764 RepID=A0A8C4QEN0_EPTBU
MSLYLCFLLSKELLFPRMTPHPGERVWVSRSGTLTITPVLASDAGRYACQAVSVAGSVMSYASIRVTKAKRLLSHPEAQPPGNHTTLAGRVTQLTCPVASSQPGVVRWLRAGSRPLTSDPRFVEEVDGTLLIRNVKVEDSGWYTCLSKNFRGQMTTNVHLDVKEYNGFVSALGEGKEQPAPPGRPIVTAVTSSSVTLTWKPSEDKAVTSYVVEAYSDQLGGAWLTVGEDIKGLRFTARGLRPGKVYLFLVRSTSALGLSQPSTLSQPIRTSGMNITTNGVLYCCINATGNKVLLDPKH